MLAELDTIQQDFNSHARVGRDEGLFESIGTWLDFNSHARVGRDEWLLVYKRRIMDFNSHARVGRDMSTSKRTKICTRNFNSHARVGRDQRAGNSRDWKK